MKAANWSGSEGIWTRKCRNKISRGVVAVGVETQPLQPVCVWADVLAEGTGHSSWCLLTQPGAGAAPSVTRELLLCLLLCGHWGCSGHPKFHMVLTPRALALATLPSDIASPVICCFSGLVFYSLYHLPTFPPAQQLCRRI